MGLETYTEIKFSVSVNLVGKNTVFILEFDDVMVKQPKTTGYEFSCFMILTILIIDISSAVL